MIDYGIEHNLYWVCFLDKNGECWTFSNTEIRAQKNITHGRELISPFYNPEDVALKKEDENVICEECYESIDECICDDKIHAEALSFRISYEEERAAKIELLKKLLELRVENNRNSEIATQLTALVRKLLADGNISPSVHPKVFSTLEEYNKD